MQIQDIIEYCLTKKKAYIDYPFCDIPICVYDIVIKSFSKKLQKEILGVENE